MQKDTCKYNQRKRKAFTLVELLIVIAIIGILFIVLISKVDFATDKAKATGVQTDFRSFQLAFETVAKENAGFNTFGWDTGDLNANGKRDSYDEGDTNKDNIKDAGEIWTGHKVPGETFTKVFTLVKPGTDFETVGYDSDAIAKLETAINANLDPKLHITINTDGTITMANGAQDPWNKEYHGNYITNATVDKKDQGAIVMYSDGANGEFGSEHSIANGVVTITVPGNNKAGQDDYSISTIYTFVNGYGEVKTSTSGFSNNQGNGQNGVGGSVDPDGGTPGDDNGTQTPDDENVPDTVELPEPKSYLNDYTWNEIKLLADANLDSTVLMETYNINLGDQKLDNGVSYTLIDLDGNHYDGFVFIHTSTSKPASEDAVESIYDTFSPELQSVIKPVEVGKYNGDVYNLLVNKRKVFLPSWNEYGFENVKDGWIYGLVSSYDINVDSYYDALIKEGEVFDYFKTATNRYKFNRYPICRTVGYPRTSTPYAMSYLMNNAQSGSMTTPVFVVGTDNNHSFEQIVMPAKSNSYYEMLNPGVYTYDLSRQEYSWDELIENGYISFNSNNFIVMSEDIYWDEYVLVVPGTIKNAYFSYNAYYGLGGLVLQHGVTTLYMNEVFWGLNNIFYISSSVQNIDMNMFGLASSRGWNYIVDTQNQYFASLDGSLFNKDMTAMVACYFEGRDESVVIPNSVTHLCGSVFNGFVRDYFEIPSHIKFINGGAFHGCTFNTFVMSPSLHYDYSSYGLEMSSIKKLHVYNFTAFMDISYGSGVLIEDVYYLYDTNPYNSPHFAPEDDFNSREEWFDYILGNRDYWFSNYNGINPPNAIYVPESMYDFYYELFEHIGYGYLIQSMSGTTQCTTHFDNDQDARCDTCYLIVCEMSGFQHFDKNVDGYCDGCTIGMCSIGVGEHIVGNSQYCAACREPLCKYGYFAHIDEPDYFIGYTPEDMKCDYCHQAMCLFGVPHTDTLHNRPDLYADGICDGCNVGMCKLGGEHFDYTQYDSKQDGLCNGCNVGMCQLGGNHFDGYDYDSQDGYCNGCNATMCQFTGIHKPWINSLTCSCGMVLCTYDPDNYYHYDYDYDGKCDGCQEIMCVINGYHDDCDFDGRCDGCLERICDVDFHRDYSGDGRCDGCNEYMCELDGYHYDYQTDWGEWYSDGYCDSCGEPMCQVGGEHLDELDYDGYCDMCGSVYCYYSMRCHDDDDNLHCDYCDREICADCYDGDGDGTCDACYNYLGY